MVFWQSGEWQVIQEKLDDLEAKGIKYNPERENLFAALDLVPLDKTRVVLIGQDPYPNSKFATGVAFSIPKGLRKFPQTLITIFIEYCKDLSDVCPTTGNLEKWCDQGVLLWNAYPTTLDGVPGAHLGWTEWDWLTKEIVELLSKKEPKVVIVFIGSVARRFVKFIDKTTTNYIEVGHPSPRGLLKAANPFVGSRLFSTINSKISGAKIDWRL
jgi:uracil-DNA glycosylase